MLPLSRQLTREESQTFAKFRLQAVVYQPYLASVLFALIPVRSPELGTFAIDRHGRLYLDPKQFDQWSLRECASVLIHEAHHLLRRHSERADALPVPADLRTLWNIAADLAINDDLVEQGLPLPSPLLPSSFQLTDGRSEEEYYRRLLKLGSDPTACRCGTGSGGLGDDELGEDTAATLGPADLARIRADVLNRLLRSGAASHGLRTALMGNTPKAPWQALLRRLLRPKLSNSVSKQHTWNRANRRNEKTFVLPGINRRGAHVGIVFDTSASMDQDLLNRAAAELSGILRAARIRTVTLVSCDDEATVPLALAPTSTISLLGGGATDLTVGIDALMALSSPPPVIVVLTDGFTPWPEAAPTGTQLICGVFDRQAPLPSGHGIEALYIP